MSITVRDNCLFFKNLTESMEFEGSTGEQAPLKALERAAKTSLAPEVYFDQVQRVNSSGLLIWVKALRLYKEMFYYCKAPEWLVGFFNERNSEFLLRGKVRSFFAPFFDQKNGVSKVILIHVNDLDPNPQSEDDLEKINWHKQPGVTRDLIIDFDPAEYLHFLLPLALSASA